MKLAPFALGRKEMIAIAGVFILLVFLFSFLIISQVNSLKKISGQLTEERTKLAEARSLIDNRQRYEKEIKLLERRIEFYEDKLPERKEVPQLFRELDKVAAESQIKFVSVEEKPPEERKHYRRFQWNLQMEGGYHELGRFINKLENLDRFIEVSNIQISSNPENFLQHNIRMEVSTFVSKERKKEKVVK